jgi:deoxyribose-phosphate aldolase
MHNPKVISNLAPFIDHTLLRPEASRKDILKICAEAVRYGFASVCILPSYVRLSARALRGSHVKVCTVVGFPLGASLTEVKVLEARRAQRDGADELDMVIDLGALKSGDWKTVTSDILAVRKAVPGKVLKVILETALLTAAEKIRAARIAKKCGADFVKTSTGFAGGATVQDVRALRKAVGKKMGIKASGGIREPAFARKLILAGASRLGTSASVRICASEIL